MPNVNTDCFNIYLQKLSEFYKNTKINLVLDGAGWHKSKTLKIPENINLIFLPPYSPELNPVEKFWQYVKRHTIKNKFFDSLKLLEICVSDFLKNINQHNIASICKLNYL